MTGEAQQHRILLTKVFQLARVQVLSNLVWLAVLPATLLLLCFETLLNRTAGKRENSTKNVREEFHLEIFGILKAGALCMQS